MTVHGSITRRTITMKLVVALCLLISLSFQSPLHAQTIHISSNSELESSVMGRAAKQIITEAYERIGIPVVFEKTNLSRAILLTDAGINDAELMRVDNINLTYTNLIQVPVSIFAAKHMAYTKDLKFTPNGWESLRPYKIAYPIGLKAASLGTRGMDTTPQPNIRRAFAAVAKGDADVAIAPLVDRKFMQTLAQMGITALQPPLVENFLFHYVHKKHAGLVPQLTRSLLQMKAEHRIAEIYKKVEALDNSQMAEKPARN